MTKDFIAYINKNNVPFNAEIKESIYETNPFLVKIQSRRNISLIKYAIFFGSIEIFNFLRMNEVKLESSLWKFAIHSQNPEIIHILEDNHFEAKNQKLLIEKENIEIIKLLLSNEKIDINIPFKGKGTLNDSIIVEGEKTALYLAVEKENIEIIELFLNNEKLDINFGYKSSENEVVGMKSQKEKLEVIQDILYMFDVDLLNEKEKNQTKVKTPLHLAVEKENISIIELLLTSKNIDVNSKEEQGKMPIDYTTNDIIKKMLT